MLPRCRASQLEYPSVFFPGFWVSGGPVSKSRASSRSAKPATSNHELRCAPGRAKETVRQAYTNKCCTSRRQPCEILSILSILNAAAKRYTPLRSSNPRLEWARARPCHDRRAVSLEQHGPGGSRAGQP